MIQDANNAPLIFHWCRNKANKRLAIGPTDAPPDSEKFMFSMSIPKRDYNDFHRLNFEKYWWLSFDSPHLRELRDRKLAR